jgi:hypothetical protein
MNKSVNQQSNDIQFVEVLKASDKELIKMYVKCSNKFAPREMRSRGLL